VSLVTRGSTKRTPSLVLWLDRMETLLATGWDRMISEDLYDVEGSRDQKGKHHSGTLSTILGPLTGSLKQKLARNFW